MAKNGYKVLDSDLRIMKPADLWQRYIEPEFKDRAPRGLTDSASPPGRPWWTAMVGPGAGPLCRPRLPNAGVLASTTICTRSK